MSDYYYQKCQAEIYQALHRLRPHNKRRFPRYIILFTNIPVEGVKVDEILVDHSDWNWVVGQRVKELLAHNQEVSVEDVAASVATPGQNIRSVTRGIDRKGEAIAILAEAWYYKGTPGKGGSRNRFAKSPITD